MNRVIDKYSYWGSVRFFKHLILTAVALAVIIPTVICIVLAFQKQVLVIQAAELSRDLAADPSIPAAEAPTWQSLYPALYAAPAQRSTVDEEKTVYLTFDDGPSARTPEILQILSKYNVKATFFVVGKSDKQSLQWMRDIVAAGHTLGIHSNTHEYKRIYASVESFLEDFEKIYNLIYEATGSYPQIFRFPGGSINGYNGATYETIISEMVRRGFVYFDWNVSTGDAAAGGSVSADKLAHNALPSVDTMRRAIVLMHDSIDKKNTVAALPDIIEGYQKAGFSFAALTPEVTPIIYAYR